MTAAVALTGATGLLGQHLRRTLRDRDVVLLSRRSVPTFTNERIHYADLGQPLDMQRLPTGTTLVHLAWTHADQTTNLNHTRRLVAAVNASSSVDRVVVLSSASVYGAFQVGRLDEETLCRPDTHYGRMKLACEHHWLTRLEAGPALTVLRPTTVLAPGGPALSTLADDALNHPARALVKRWLLQRTSVHFVAIGDVVAAIRLVMDRDVRPRRDLLIVAADNCPENRSYASLQDAVRSTHGRPCLPTPWLPRIADQPLRSVSGLPIGIQRTFSAAKLSALGFSTSPTLRPAVEDFCRTSCTSASLRQTSKAEPV